MLVKNDPSSIKPELQKCRRYTYIPIREELWSDEIGKYISYGICALDRYTKVDFVSDVSTDYDLICAFTEICTLEALDPIHLRDAIEDLLSDPNTYTKYLKK